MKNTGRFDTKQLEKFGINIGDKKSDRMFNSAESMDMTANTPDVG
jgi:hypothetical protein